jgi:hypothetical protein
MRLREEVGAVMKKIACLYIAAISIGIFVCGWNNGRAADRTLSEDDAIKKLAEDISDKKKTFENKKLSIDNFSNLEGKETDEGKRISKKLLGYLIQKGNMKFIERTELDKILKEQGIEQTGIIDTELAAGSGKVLPVDALITGTVAQIDNRGEITVKIIAISSGEIYFASTVSFIPTEKFTYQENQEIVKLNKKMPDVVAKINNTYNALTMMSTRRPYLYIYAMSDENDPAITSKPKLQANLKKRIASIQETNNQLYTRVMRLKRNVPLIKQYAPKRYIILKDTRDKLLKGGLKGNR